MDGGGPLWRASKSHPVTVLAGLKNKLGPGVQVTYVAGPLPTRDFPSMMDAIMGAKTVAAAHARLRLPSWMAKAKAAAADADIVIAVLGEARLHEQRSGLTRHAGFARHSGADAGGRGLYRQAGRAGAGERPPARYSLGCGARSCDS